MIGGKHNLQKIMGWGSRNQPRFAILSRWPMTEKSGPPILEGASEQVLILQMMLMIVNSYFGDYKFIWWQHGNHCGDNLTT